MHPVIHADGPELLVVDAPWQVVTDTRGRVIRWSSATTPAAAAGWYVYLREPLTSPSTVRAVSLDQG